MVFTIYFLLVGALKGEWLSHLLSGMSVTLGYMFIYYSQQLFILPRFYKQKFVLFCLISIDFLMYEGWNGLISKVVPQSYTEIKKSCFLSGDASVTGELLLFCLISAAALGRYQNKIDIARIRTKREKERLVLIKELGFIKNQFNSHITFNFLNYCYSKVHRHSNEIAESIEVFSKMLRYSMSCRVEKKVPLDKEIEYLEDFIRVKKLLNEEVKIVFFKTSTEQVYILPRVLINFVEHAFKQDNLNSGRLPVRIELYACDTFICLTVENEKQNQADNTLRRRHKNLRQQLDLFYKNKYTLETAETAISCQIKLKLMI